MFIQVLSVFEKVQMFLCYDENKAKSERNSSPLFHAIQKKKYKPNIPKMCIHLHILSLIYTLISISL